MINMRHVAFLLAALACSTVAAQARPYKAAIFDLELIDTSFEGEGGERADQTRRIELASAELRKLLTASGQIEMVDLAPKAQEIDKKGPLYKCNGCDEDIARDLGADIEVTSVVQKTSNLILSFTILFKDLKSGKVIRAGSTDIRNNTDEMWLRGVRYLVKNRLLETPLPEPQ